MEDTRQFTVVMTNKEDIQIANQFRAITKYQALDIAFYQYPKYKQYQCGNIVRTRYWTPKENSVARHKAD
jgi:hypothetical protein